MENLNKENIEVLRALLGEKETDLLEKQEELESQREMLSAAINELDSKNKNLEETLAKLNEVNVELRQLLYQSSHGLRSPLSSIMGIINLMGREPMNDTLREYKGHVEYKIATMLEILNSLTTLAALDGTKVNAIELNVHAIFSACAKHFSQLALENNTTLEFPSETDLKVIICDQFLLTAIMKQVIMNGIIFRDAQKQGFVRITTSVSEDGTKLNITVEDDGEGIAPKAGNTIFKMFVRGSGKSGGSGLGLYIAKKAVDLLHGSISFTTGDGKTQFVISIPLLSSSTGVLNQIPTASSSVAAY